MCNDFLVSWENMGGLSQIWQYFYHKIYCTAVKIQVRKKGQSYNLGKISSVENDEEVL